MPIFTEIPATSVRPHEQLSPKGRAVRISGCCASQCRGSLRTAWRLRRIASARAIRLGRYRSDAVRNCQRAPAAAPVPMPAPSAPRVCRRFCLRPYSITRQLSYRRRIWQQVELTKRLDGERWYRVSLRPNWAARVDYRCTGLNGFAVRGHRGRPVCSKQPQRPDGDHSASATCSIEAPFASRHRS